MDESTVLRVIFEATCIGLIWILSIEAFRARRMGRLLRRALDHINQYYRATWDIHLRATDDLSSDGRGPRTTLLIELNQTMVEIKKNSNWRKRQNE